jgi:lipopolysaccharide export system protein LptA
MLMRSSLATLLTISTLVGAAHAQPSSGSSSADTLASSSLFDQKLKDDTFAKAPTNIKSDSLTINAKDRVFVYKGNVEVTQGDMMLISKTLEGFYTENNQIQKLIAKGDVVITKQDIKATSQQAIYDAPSAVVTLTDNPQLQQKESILIADRIKVFLNENRSQAEGSVRVTVVNDKEKDKSAIPAKKPEEPKPGDKPQEASPVAAAGTTPKAAS